MMQIEKDFSKKKIDGIMRLNHAELTVLLNNLRPICEEIKNLENLNDAIEPLEFTVKLSRTKTFKVFKEMKKNKIVCGFSRPRITKNGRKYTFCMLVSAKKWKQLDTCFRCTMT